MGQKGLFVIYNGITLFFMLLGEIVKDPASRIMDRDKRTKSKQYYMFEIGFYT